MQIMTVPTENLKADWTFQAGDIQQNFQSKTSVV